MTTEKKERRIVETSDPRKVVQIEVIEASKDIGLMALCNDGTIWLCAIKQFGEQTNWSQFDPPPIHQDEGQSDG